MIHLALFILAFVFLAYLGCILALGVGLVLLRLLVIPIDVAWWVYVAGKGIAARFSVNNACHAVCKALKRIPSEYRHSQSSQSKG